MVGRVPSYFYKKRTFKIFVIIIIVLIIILYLVHGEITFFLNFT